MNNQVWKTFAQHEVSHSAAHYLTTIHDLNGNRGYARVSDVAKELDVTKGSVSVQMKHLREKGWVTEDENRFLQLTEIGQSVAVDVLDNRRVLIRFLCTVLGLGEEQAETDACKIEHLLSSETGGRLKTFVELLESGTNDAKAVLEKFRGFELECPTFDACHMCEEQCLVDLEPCDYAQKEEAQDDTGKSAP
jgi:DtxR family Mn-dependent transcriptional regulator